MSNFEPVIGLEIHAQINTKSKMFCSCSNDSFGAEPNTNVCPVCMGFPGMLPVMNEGAFKKGILAALSLHCSIPEFSKFDRKNYFYPDLPKGFQISQYDQPIAVNGYLDIDIDERGSGFASPSERKEGGRVSDWKRSVQSRTELVGETLVSPRLKRIRLNRLHLEDDAGKLIHEASGTFCDYNRSGCPLMEIVSEPDLRSLEEASAYAHEIQRVLRYVGASDCDMEKGMMRFDINVSIRKKGESKFGTRAEVKNLNSFRALERAIAYEISRQTEVVESGEKIVQETRGWDDAKGVTEPQRSKEEAHDYRYFPEPDLPPLLVEKPDIDEYRKHLPELPSERRKRFVAEYGIAPQDAIILTEARDMADYFEAAAKVSGDAKKTVSFMNTILLKHLNEDGKGLSACKVSAENLGRLVALINEGGISNNMAKTEVFEAMYADGKSPEEIVQARGLAVVSDTGAIEALCKKVMQENPSPVADFRAGKQNAFGFLVGQAMKSSQGKGNPKIINEILHRLLS